MEVEDGLRDDLETLRRCTIEGNVEGAKQVVFECEKMFKLSFIDQRVNYHMSAMRKDEFSTALIPREVELRSCIALKTTGNANCMFNAALLLLAENESLSDVIRLLIAGVRASDISRGRGPAKFRSFREIPRNSQKNAKYREIRQKYFQIHVGKTYLILILAIRPVLFTPNVQI